MSRPVLFPRRVLCSRVHRTPLQGGFALITSLLMLVVVTILALAMFRGIGLQEKIAGNTMEKQRSLQAAEIALQYGEWWLNQGNGGPGTVCTSVYNANVVTNVQTCSNPLTTPTALPWSARGDYTPPNMTVASGGGLTTSGANTGDVNYSAKPSLYISYLGLDATGQMTLYQVTGVGYGGSTNGASVVRSTYAMRYKNPPLDNP